MVNIAKRKKHFQLYSPFMAIYYILYIIYI